MLNENIGAETIVEMTWEEVIEAIYPMGHQQDSYDTELHGILKATQKCFQICQRKHLTKRHISLFTDNEAAIKCLNTPKPGDGQSTSLALSNSSNYLHAVNSMTTAQWVPAYTVIPGNEHADKLAKNVHSQKPPTDHNTFISYLKSITQADTVQEWGNLWMRHPAKRKYNIRTFHTKPDNIFICGNHQLTSTVTQLQTQHGYLHSYLFKLPNNSVDSPPHPCHFGGSQSPEHLLLRYPLYQYKREMMQNEIGVVHFWYLLKHLPYTDKAIQHTPLTTHLTTWFCDPSSWTFDM
jgi:ribonuclease HI